MNRHLNTAFVVLLAAALAFSGATTRVNAQDTGRNAAVLPAQSEILDRQILVELDPARTIKSTSAFFSAKGVSQVNSLDLSYTSYRIVRVPDTEDFAAAYARLASDPTVR